MHGWEWAEPVWAEDAESAAVGMMRGSRRDRAIVSEANELVTGGLLPPQKRQKTATITATADNTQPAIPSAGAPPAPKEDPTCKTCSSCRQKKLKCDGSRPTCRQCESREIECIYPPDYRKEIRGPNEHRLDADEEVAPLPTPSASTASL